MWNNKDLESYKEVREIANVTFSFDNKKDLSNLKKLSKIGHSSGYFDVFGTWLDEIMWVENEANNEQFLNESSFINITNFFTNMLYSRYDEIYYAIKKIKDKEYISNLRSRYADWEHAKEIDKEEISYLRDDIRGFKCVLKCLYKYDTEFLIKFSRALSDFFFEELIKNNKQTTILSHTAFFIDKVIENTENKLMKRSQMK